MKFVDVFDHYIFVSGSLILPVDHVLSVASVQENVKGEICYKVHVCYDNYGGLGKEIAKKNLFSSVPISQMYVVTLASRKDCDQLMEELAIAMKAAKKNLHIE